MYRNKLNTKHGLTRHGHNVSLLVGFVYINTGARNK